MILGIGLYSAISATIASFMIRDDQWAPLAASPRTAGDPAHGGSSERRGIRRSQDHGHRIRRDSLRPSGRLPRSDPICGDVALGIREGERAGADFGVEAVLEGVLLLAPDRRAVR